MYIDWKIYSKEMMKTQIKIAQAIILIPVPAKKPLKEPNAAVKARFVSELSWISSPTKAPAKGSKDN